MSDLAEQHNWKRPETLASHKHCNLARQVKSLIPSYVLVLTRKQPANNTSGANHGNAQQLTSFNKPIILASYAVWPLGNNRPFCKQPHHDEREAMVPCGKYGAQEQCARGKCKTWTFFFDQAAALRHYASYYNYTQIAFVERHFFLFLRQTPVSSLPLASSTAAACWPSKT